MSIIIKKLLLLQGRTTFLFNCCTNRIINNNLRVFSSTKRNSKNIIDDYKVVKSSIRTHENEWLEQEGGPNWELFATCANRFYLPGSMGPAWQGETTIQNYDEEEFLPNLVDLNSNVQNKLNITLNKCPVLLRKNIHELFPVTEDFSKGNINVLTLSYPNDIDFEASAVNFVLVAREISNYLRNDNYWADFMNPFIGKPFFGFIKGKHLYKIDNRFRGLGMRLDKQNECVIISSSIQTGFTGNIFTNAPNDFELITTLINLCSYNVIKK